MLKTTSKYGRQKYTIQLADIVNLGAALTGDVTLDTLPPGAVLKAVLIKASVAIAGGTIATATAQPKFAGTLVGSTTNVFAVAAEPANALQTLAGTVGTISSTNALAVTLTTTVGNLNAATAGQIDVEVDYSVLTI
jgi:hypothetical protein